jgi:hypothetical protein
MAAMQATREGRGTPAAVEWNRTDQGLGLVNVDPVNVAIDPLRECLLRFGHKFDRKLVYRPSFSQLVFCCLRTLLHCSCDATAATHAHADLGLPVNVDLRSQPNQELCESVVFTEISWA